jgi:hypothetical protein
MAIEKPKRHKSPDIDHIPAELIEARRRTIRSEIHELIISSWNEEELPEDWMRSIILPIFTKVDKTEFSNYRGISRLSITYKIEFKILLSEVTPNVVVISGDRQCGFRRSRSTTDDIY